MLDIQAHSLISKKCSCLHEIRWVTAEFQ